MHTGAKDAVTCTSGERFLITKSREGNEGRLTAQAAQSDLALQNQPDGYFMIPVYWA
jgi:hypothetical protein